MKEIILQNKNGKILASSRDVAERFGKRNSEVNRTIKNLIMANPETKKHFIVSKYKSSRGRYENDYLLDETGLNLLNFKFGFSLMSPRFEIKFQNLLQELFLGLKIIHQYFINGYKLDFFIPDLNMIIEYDEDHHKYTSEQDHNRMNIIIDTMYNMIKMNKPLYEEDTNLRKTLLKNPNLFSVIRVKKGNEITGIKDICKKIETYSNFSCTYFMNANM